MSSAEDQITGWFASQSNLPSEDFPIGIGDDMAEIRIGKESVLITTDMLLDGVHFDLEKVSLKQVGYKAMAVSLSDCAAMATVPVAAVVAVAMPDGYGSDELKDLHAGIMEACDKYGCQLVGGDITSWKKACPFAINVAMLSKAAAGINPVTRSGAKVGDVICVTGTLGGSLYGRHMEFEPRVNEALKIAGLVGLNSMMDLSDGLSSDLKRICRKSGVGAIINAEDIPISKAAEKGRDRLGAALNDGEDFELLFTLSEADYSHLIDGWDENVKITAIGEITDSGKVQIKSSNGALSDLKAKGYEHLGG